MSAWDLSAAISAIPINSPSLIMTYSRPSLIIAYPGGDLRDRLRLQFHRDHRPLDVDDASLYAVEPLEAVLFINLLMDLQAFQKNWVDPFSYRPFQRRGYQAVRDSGSTE